MEIKKVKLLGFNIDTFDFKSAISYAKTLIESKNGGQIVTINPEMIEMGLKNPDYAEILNNADLIIPDGIGIKIGLKIKGINVKRIAGIEFSHRMLEECAENNFSVGLIGAKPEIINKTAANLKSEFKKINIVYTQDGYFKNKDEVLRSLAEKAPQFLLVALGSPKQEKFITEARKVLPDSLMIGVGGSFDVWSGEIQRAPEVYQKLGLEWLYRTVKEPKRFKRIFPTLPKFILRVILNK
jgi:N-acetylglucosaminyldiphosphoundecaprenol N-acetyl-beta-D-mannosaminyltransferase